MACGINCNVGQLLVFVGLWDSVKIFETVKKMWDGWQVWCIPAGICVVTSAKIGIRKHRSTTHYTLSLM